MSPFAARLAWQGSPASTPATSSRPSHQLSRTPHLSASFAYSINVAPTPSDKVRQRVNGTSQNALPKIHNASDFLTGPQEFEEDTELLKELRRIFDWMAQEKGAVRIPSRKFKQRLPELHRRMPHISISFMRMDANSDCWLEWSEFVQFCLTDVKLMQQMRRTTTVSVYAKEKSGETSFKELVDPRRMCEVGSIPPLLPWETSHVIEWRIENLVIGSTPGCPVLHGPMQIRAGMSLASPPFKGAGVCGFLRFWPSGYWTEAQHRFKMSGFAPHFIADESSQGPYPMPHPSAWCCLGCCMPAGTHLVLRFFVGDQKSEKRECYWHEGTHPGTLWSPEASGRPVLNPGDSMTVGVEIFRNLGPENIHPSKRHKHPSAKVRTPLVRDFSEVVQEDLKELAEKRREKTLGVQGKATSLPALPNASTWRSLDTLLQANRSESPQNPR